MPVVTAYKQHHPKLAPFLTELGAFDVFASPWFSAIYLLLFISLVGCLFPRLRVYYMAMRRVPPDAPARLHRMPVNASSIAFTEAPDGCRLAAAGVLRARRYRTVVRSHQDGSVTVSAEKGYLKEAGNLLFHFSLLAMLIGVAFGSWYGWHGDRLLVSGADTAFCNTPSRVRRPAPRRAGHRVDAGAVLPDARPVRRGLRCERAPADLRGRNQLLVGLVVEADPENHQGQRPAAAAERERLPARPRVRADREVHRQVRAQRNEDRTVQHRR